MKKNEIEKVYLLKRLPTGISDCKSKIIKVGDFYDSNSIDALKIRQKADIYELIKKEASDSEEKRIEHTITIKKGEFEILWKAVRQNHEKECFFYPLGKLMCEVDIYKGKLLGYARVEVEFDNEKDMNNFTPPDWFGEEITKFNHDIHEDLGLISFEDIKKRYSERGINLTPIQL